MNPQRQLNYICWKGEDIDEKIKMEILEMVSSCMLFDYLWKGFCKKKKDLKVKSFQLKRESSKLDWPHSSVSHTIKYFWFYSYSYALHMYLLIFPLFVVWFFSSVNRILFTKPIDSSCLSGAKYLAEHQNI